MTRAQARAMHARGYTWREIGRLCDAPGWLAWLLFGPLGWRTP